MIEYPMYDVRKKKKGKSETKRQGKRAKSGLGRDNRVTLGCTSKERCTEP